MTENNDQLISTVGAVALAYLMYLALVAWFNYRLNLASSLDEDEEEPYHEFGFVTAYPSEEDS